MIIRLTFNGIAFKLISISFYIISFTVVTLSLAFYWAPLQELCVRSEIHIQNAYKKRYLNWAANKPMCRWWNIFLRYFRYFSNFSLNLSILKAIPIVVTLYLLFCFLYMHFDVFAHAILVERLSMWCICFVYSKRRETLQTLMQLGYRIIESIRIVFVLVTFGFVVAVFDLKTIIGSTNFSENEIRYPWYVWWSLLYWTL